MQALLFPGQGSQKVGMGGELFDTYAHITKEASEVLGYDIKALCLENKHNLLDNTQYSQPAIYTVNALHLEAFKQNNDINAIEFVAGHSLGEYNALLAADVFDFKTGLQLVKKRGELMAQAKDGGMAAVIGLSEEEIKIALESEALFNIDFANYNTHEQIVISGSKQEVEASKEVLENAGAKMVILLQVSGAFHSRFMNEAQLDFSDFCQAFKLNNPKIKVVANVTAAPYGSEIHETLGLQINNSVKWHNSVLHMLSAGSTEFIEIGDSKILTGMVNKIKKAQKVSA
jgi:malonyl CoA-acyl carrier protein transacylase